MPKFNFVLLYVENPVASAAFYERLLGRKPVDVAPAFAMLPLCEGVTLGLWARGGVKPAAAGAPGAGEIALMAADRAEVDATHAAWAGRGIAIAQTPVALDFGYTFTALDPDGHRVRVMVAEGA